MHYNKTTIKNKEKINKNCNRLLTYESLEPENINLQKMERNDLNLKSLENIKMSSKICSFCDMNTSGCKILVTKEKEKIFACSSCLEKQISNKNKYSQLFRIKKFNHELLKEQNKNFDFTKTNEKNNSSLSLKIIGKNSLIKVIDRKNK